MTPSFEQIPPTPLYQRGARPACAKRSTAGRGDFARLMGKVNSIVLSLVLASTMSAEASSTLRQIPAVVHAHSTFSSGDQTLDELITRARAVGIETIFLSENHLQ